VKGGGHSSAGFCMNDQGLVLDMSKFMVDVSWGEPVDDRSSIIVQGGVTAGAILHSWKVRVKV